MNPINNERVSDLQIDNSRVPELQEATPNPPAQRKNIEQLLDGQPMPPYLPQGAAANYNPLNMETPANQIYWRGNLGHQPPDAGRGEGYIYKSDGDFIQQMKKEQAEQRLAEGLRAPITEQRAAMDKTANAQPVMPPEQPAGRVSDLSINSGEFRDNAKS